MIIELVIWQPSLRNKNEIFILLKEFQTGNVLFSNEDSFVDVQQLDYRSMAEVHFQHPNQTQHNLGTAFRQVDPAQHGAMTSSESQNVAGDELSFWQKLADAQILIVVSQGLSPSEKQASQVSSFLSPRRRRPVERAWW
jgi:hypothetical protein